MALVTGGARRIGKAISETLARHGYAVAIHCHNSGTEAACVKSHIEAQGGRAAVIRTDLSDPAAAGSLMEEAEAALGPVTLLVNNASEFEPDGIGSLDVARWDRHFSVNLRLPVFLADAFASRLPAGRDGAIVNIIDQRVLKPTPHFLSYALTKAGLFAATRTLAQALAPRIRVNGVGPGPTLANSRQDSEDFRRQTDALLLRRGPSPEDIADAVLYLARARSVTGQMIAVDGGQHLAWETPDVLVNE
ncbi:SDR family oxidoreductase [Microvirga sp. BT291]|nr:SDR family oxidoreductase [Microvirga pudoricolor]